VAQETVASLISPIIGLIIGLVIAAALGWLVNWDAKNQGDKRAGSWGAGTFLLAIIVLPLYVIFRLAGRIGVQCPNCHKPTPNQFVNCKHCGVSLLQTEAIKPISAPVVKSGAATTQTIQMKKSAVKSEKVEKGRNKSAVLFSVLVVGVSILVLGYLAYPTPHVTVSYVSYISSSTATLPTWIAWTTTGKVVSTSFLAQTITTNAYTYYTAGTYYGQQGEGPILNYYYTTYAETTTTGTNMLVYTVTSVTSALTSYQSTTEIPLASHSTNTQPLALYESLGWNYALIVVVVLVLCGGAVAAILLRSRAAKRVEPKEQIKQPPTPILEPTKPVPSNRDAMFCRECGAKIPRDSIFCEECGTKLA
jgi:flagellar basal body-associated protein FliL